MYGTASCMGFKIAAKDIQALRDDLNDVPANFPVDFDQFVEELTSRLRQLSHSSLQVRPSRSTLLNRSRELEELNNAESLTSDGPDVYAAKARLLARERILFADDDHHLRSLVGGTLEAHGAEQIKLACNGQEVLDLIPDFKPTLIITDWLMKPVTGLALTKEVRAGKTPLDKDVIIMLFTSLKSRHDIAKANKAGVNKLIAKPVMPNVIVETALQLVEKKFRLNKQGMPRYIKGTDTGPGYALN